MSDITQDQVKELFEYRDGALFWKHRIISRGRKLKKGGQKVSTIAPDGYLRIGFNNRQYLVHRVIFLYHHGYLPECLDHINGNRSDNRIENLRPATKYENICNSKLRSDNTSGIKGVNWNKIKNRWQARIFVNKKAISLGYYKDLELAELVMMEARDKYHGKFANNGH